MGIRAAELAVKIGADTTDAERGFDRVDKRIQSFGQKAAITGGLLTAGITLPLIGVAKQALDTAMDYESALNLMQAVSGATDEQMRQVAKTAKELGADMSLPATSAGDAANAMTELAKAGLSVNDTLAAAKGVLQLAAAGSLSEARSAEIAANALNAFHLEGKEATRIANLLAAAANTSSAEVTDVADSLQMASAVFASANIPIEDLVTTIGEMANAGMKGSDAGTSLKQMLLALQAPTKKSKELMQSLGISIYNSQGRMLPFRNIIQQFTRTLGGLTQEQRDQALATIFGSDAVRAANVVMMGGVEAFDKMHEAVNRQGAAEELAEARTKGLKGALEGLWSQVETVLLTVAEPFLKDLEGIARATADWVGKLTQLNPVLLKAILIFLGFAAATGPVIAALGAVAFAIGAIGGAFWPIILGMLALGIGVALLYVAWEKNWGWIREKTQVVIDWFKVNMPILKQTVADVGKDPVQLVIKVGADAQKTAEEWAEALREAARKEWEKEPMPVPTPPKAFWEVWWDVLKRDFDWLKQAWLDAGAAATTASNAVFSAISTAASGALAGGLWALGFLRDQWLTFGANMTAASNQITTEIIAAWHQIPAGVEWVWAQLKLGWQGVWDFITGKKSTFGFDPSGMTRRMGANGGSAMLAALVPFQTIADFFMQDLPDAVGWTYREINNLITWISAGGEGGKALANVIQTVLVPFKEAINGISLAIEWVWKKIQPLIDKLNDLGNAVKGLPIFHNSPSAFELSLMAAGRALDALGVKVDASPLMGHSPSPFEVGLRGIVGALGAVRSSMARVISPTSLGRISTAYSQLAGLRGDFTGSKDQQGRRPQGLGDLPLQVQSMGVLNDLQRNVLGAFMPGFNAANAGIAGLGDRITTTFTDTRAEARASFESMARIAADLSGNRLGTLSGSAATALSSGSRQMFDLLRAYSQGQVNRWTFRDQGKRLTDGLASRLAGYAELAPLVNVLKAWRGIANASYREGYRPGDEAHSHGRNWTTEQEQRERNILEGSRRYGNPLTAILGARRGADFVVPPGYSNDSFLMGVESGEHVKVTPAGKGDAPEFHLHLHTSAPVRQETVVSGFYMARALAGARR